MVKRCGFFLKDGKIHRQDVQIGWEYGFTRDAKLMYISELHMRLTAKGLTDVEEITTASGTKYRKLSPVYIPSDDGVTVEDQCQFAIQQFKAVGKSMPKGLFDYLYLIAIKEEQREMILSKKCFTDVFYNPDKTNGTQALTAVIYQYLWHTNNLSLLDDIHKFLKWYSEECLPNIIILD